MWYFLKHRGFGFQDGSTCVLSHIAFYQLYYQSPFYQSYSKEDIFWFDYFLT